MESETRAFPFAFELARSKQLGNILPPTFYPSESTRTPFKIAYQVTATWEPLKLTGKSSLVTIPIVIRPDPDFQSLDGAYSISMRSQRAEEFEPQTITIPPDYATHLLDICTNLIYAFFRRIYNSAALKTLAREIATDATISISVLRQMTITEDSAVISTTPETLLSGSSEARSLRFKTKVLKRIKLNSSLWSPQSSMTIDPPQKPLPSLPAHYFSDARIVYNGMCICFPKRPRHQLNEQKEYPTLDTHRALPDGLHKGTIILNRNMLTSIDWGGVSLKYFLEVTVLLGQDEL